MRARSRSKWLALLLATVFVPASATFHFMKIVELFPGTPAAPAAHYVVLQMYASGQQFVGGHQLTVHDAAGQAIETLTFPGDLSNGANQARILIATQQAQDFFGVAADLTMSASLLRAGGKVCFAETVDCVAWGGYAGSAAGVGTPFNRPAGLQSGRAAVRRLDRAGAATTLDAGDDTDNCATDFVFGTPAPRNNAGALGTVPGSTCGNRVLEGLEQCDDGNLASDDGCSSTCRVDQARTQATTMAGDYNGDGRSDVFWRNLASGGNAIWLSANNATPQAVASVSNTDWNVAGLGRFDAGSTSDVVWRNARTGANVIWRSANHATPLAMAAVTNLAWSIVGVGDFDGDGRSDLFWRNGATGANAIWRSANNRTTQPVSGVSNLAWQVVGVGDFNNDGRSDVFWRNVRTGANVVWRSANPATSQAVTGVSNLAWQVAGTGDFDGDGWDDVFWRNASSGANVIWRRALSTSAQAVTGVSNRDWKVVQTGDYNNDGRTDVLWRNARTGANVVWRSAVASTPQSVAPVANLNWVVVPYVGSVAPGTAPAPSLSIADVAASEGDGGSQSMTFTVRLSAASTAPVTYSIGTANGSASAGTDYVARSLSGETIPAGQASRAFAVEVNGDTAIESNEEFRVSLSAVAGASVADGSATGTIVNDDEYGY
jgi:cysteine-rich repeat protein